MTAQEIIRIQHIEHYCVHACSFTELTESLQVSIRHTRRLIAQFRRDGPQSLVHGLRGRPSNHRLKEDHRNHVKEIIQSKYSTFKPTFVKEKLEEQEGIILSDETVRKIMTDMNLWKPILRSEQRIFQLRERKEAHGMMIQFDGSYHVWLPDVLPLVKWCLLVAIDDATSQITKAEFCDDEGIDDVFPFWHTYVSELGVPESIYCDRFSTYKSNHPESPDIPTQFGRACKTLDIDLIFALSPQAKGRVERVNKTLQDRLVSEMRLAKIKTQEEANIFLREVYIPKHNKKFAVIPRSESNQHRMLREDQKQQLESIFSLHYQRKIMNDFTLSFKTQIYQLHTGGATVWRGEQVQVEQGLSGEIILKQRNKIILYSKILHRPEKGYKLPLPPKHPSPTGSTGSP